MGPGASQTFNVELLNNGEADSNPPTVPFKLQVALKTNVDIFAFFVPCSLSVLLIPTEPVPIQTYQELSSKENLAKKQDSIPTQMENDALKEKFKNNNLSYVGSRFNQSGVGIFLSFYSRAYEFLCQDN